MNTRAVEGVRHRGRALFGVGNSRRPWVYSPSRAALSYHWRMSILIVDDSPHVHMLLKQALESAGFGSITTVTSAKEAFELLGLEGGGDGSPRAPFELILMDVVMPRINGFEACRRIKAKEALRDIPIIVITGNTELIDVNAAFKAGAFAVVYKPFQRELLLNAVQSALARRQR